MKSVPWWIVVGVAAAVAAIGFTRWQPGRWFLRSAASLARALSAILVPLIVIAVYTSSYYGARVQVVAGAIGAALLWYLCASEGRISKDRVSAVDALRDAGGWLFRMTASLFASVGTSGISRLSRRQLDAVVFTASGVVLFVVAGVLVLQGAKQSFRVGLLLLGAVVVLRLFGYATSVRRWMVVAAVGILTLRLALFGGQFPGEDALDEPRQLFWASVAIPLSFLLGALVAETRNLRGEDAPVPSTEKRRLRGAGFVVAFVSAASFGIAIWNAHDETTTGTADFPRAYHAVESVNLEPQTDRNDLALALTYAPALRLHGAEVYLPASAGDYHAWADPVACTGPKAAPDCTKLACIECADEQYSKNVEKHPEGLVLYARVARGAELAAWPDDARSVDPLTIMVQYWIFYNYNRWTAKTPVGDLVQEHDSDWEFVGIGLTSEKKPLFVALSAHCGGQLVPWNEDLAVLRGAVEAGDLVAIEAPDPDLDRDARSKDATHPLVAVALGSHANYADDSSRRPPDWESCLDAPLQALKPVVYAADVRDETAAAADKSQLKTRATVKVVTREDFPMTVAGAWGTEMISFRHRTWPNRSGPKSPPVQRRSWRNAIHTFLCSRYWERDDFFDPASSATCK